MASAYDIIERILHADESTVIVTWDTTYYAYLTHTYCSHNTHMAEQARQMYEK